MPDRFMKIQSQYLEDARSDTAEVDESFDGIGHFSNQILAAAVVYPGQIALRSSSDSGPGMGPEPVEKCSHQVFEHLKLTSILNR